MGYQLLGHDEYLHPQHPPARLIAPGDTVALAFRNLEGYKVTEVRTALVRRVDGDEVVLEMREAGMMVDVGKGEEVRAERRHLFRPPPSGELLDLSDTLVRPPPPELRDAIKARQEDDDE